MKTIEVKGNFLVVTDTVSGDIGKPFPRNNTRFYFEVDGETNYLVLVPISLVTVVNSSDNNILFDVAEITGFEDIEELKEFLYVNLGGRNELIFSNRTKLADYKLTESSKLPTTFAKLDMSRSVLGFETAPIFDKVNSRITGFVVGEVGSANISISVDSSTGTNKWIAFELRGYDNTDALLFTKRSVTIPLVKNLSDDEVKTSLEFYFSGTLSYFEIWYRGSSAMDYENPELTVIKY